MRAWVLLMLGDVGSLDPNPDPDLPEKG